MSAVDVAAAANDPPAGAARQIPPAPLPPPSSVSDVTAPPRAPARVLAWVDRHRRVLLTVVVLLYVAAFNGQWRPEPDSALYLAVGRNLAEGRGYTYHGAPHSLVFPGLPLLFAGVFKAFGGHNLVAPHAVMLAVAFAALALTYRLFLLHAGRPTAVLMTLLVGVSRTFFQYGYELLSDLPFLLTVLAFLCGYEAILHRCRANEPLTAPGTEPRGSAAGPINRRPSPFDWFLLIGGLAGAVVTRPAMVALILAVAGTVAWSLARGRFRWGGVLILLGVVAAGVTFYLLDPRRHAVGQPGVAAVGGGYEAVLQDKGRLLHVLHRAVAENLWRIFHPTVAEAVFGMDLGVSVNPWVSAILLAAGAVVLFRTHVLWGMLLLATLAMMGVEVHVRYLLFVLPLMLYALWRALVWVNHRLPRARGEVVFACVFGLLLATNVTRVAGFIAGQRKPHVLQTYKRGKFAALDALAAAVRQHVEPGGWLLVQPRLGRILTYKSGRYAVEPVVSAATIDPRTQPVYVLDPIETVDEKTGEVDARTRDWMAERHFGRGALIATVPDGHGGQWTLYRVAILP
jgi:hypothetical protein